jgi:MFS family permease
VAPAGRRSTVVALAAAIALALLGDYLVFTVLPSNPGVAGIGVAALGLVLSVHRFIRLAANPLGGLLYDRLGRRRPFLLGMALAVAATSGYLVSQGLWSLLAARLVWGCAFALLSVGGLSIVMDLTVPADRGRTLGLYHGLVGVGSALGFTLGGILADLVGYRGTLALYVPWTALGWLVAFLALRETHAGTLAPTTGEPAASHARPAVLDLVGLGPRVAVPAFVSFANFFASHGVLMGTLGVFLKEHAAAGPVPVASLTGLLLAMRRLLAIGAGPAAGFLADSAGRRLAAALGTVVSLAGFLVLIPAGSTAAIVLGVALISFGEGMIHPPVAAWIGDATPPALRGVVMGSFAAVNDLGGALGPLVGYALAATAGLSWAYRLSAGLMLAALLAIGVRS